MRFVRFLRFSAVLLPLLLSGCVTTKSNADPCEGRTGCGPTIITGYAPNLYQKDADSGWQSLEKQGREEPLFSVRIGEGFQHVIGIHALLRGPADVILVDDCFVFSDSPLYEIAWLGSGEMLREFDFHDTLYTIRFADAALESAVASITIEYEETYAFKQTNNLSNKLTIRIVK